MSRAACSRTLLSHGSSRWAYSSAPLLHHHQQFPALPPLTQKRCLSIAQLDEAKKGRERVLILGSGWAGFCLSRRLDPSLYQAVVVSPRSYFVFTPLLASTSVGTLEFRTALEPVRSKRSRVEFLQGWADGVDLEGRKLTVEEAVDETNPSGGRLAIGEREKKGGVFEVGWDKLIVAVGCYSQTFGTPGVRENALFLKDVGDARKIRQRLLACFETASLPTTSDEMKKCLLNFAVVGGGPTGIEFSAELHDIIAEDMSKLYPTLMPFCNVTVYDVAPNVLSMFDKKLGDFAINHLRREGVHVKTSHHVEELRRGPPKPILDKLRTSGPDLANAAFTLKTKEEGEVGVGMCVWSTGLMMNPFVQEKLAGAVQKHPRTGAVMVDEKLRVLVQPEHQGKKGKPHTLENVFALGDCASVQDKSYPATAQVANQQAQWLAKRLNARDISSPSTQGFHWRNMGIMAYLGNWNAILQSSGGEVSGRTAWFLWRSAYLTMAVSWRNKILIPVYWFVNWLFGRDVSRF